MLESRKAVALSGKLFLFVVSYAFTFCSLTNKMAVSVDPIGTGSSRLPLTLDKMDDFGERKENCRVSGLAA